MSKVIPSKALKKMFYCYALLDPRKPGDFNYGPGASFKFEPFYIGYGSGNRSEVHVKHAISGNYTENPHKVNKIRKILKLGVSVIVVRTNLGNQEKAQNREIELIRLIGRKDLHLGPLTNLTDGGEGAVGAKPTRATIEKRKAGIRNFYDSMTKSERAEFKRSHGEKVSKAKKGKSLSTKGKQNMRVPKSLIGRINMSLGQKGKISGRRGTTNTVEHCRKMSLARVGIPWSKARRMAHVSRKGIPRSMSLK